MLPQVSIFSLILHQFFLHYQMGAIKEIREWLVLAFFRRKERRAMMSFTEKPKEESGVERGTTTSFP